MTKTAAATFGASLRRLIDHLDGALEQAYRDEGLDFRPRYTPIARQLADYGPQTLRSLATAIGLSHSAISQTISQMTARGLVATSPGADARERIVALSAAARTLLPRLQRHWDAAEIATFALSEEAGGMLVESVERANRALAERTMTTRLQEAATDPSR